MNIFRRLFGGDDNNRDYRKPDIDSLLTTNDTSHAIIEIDNYVSRICSWGENLDVLTEPQKYLYLNQSLEREINNGGFSQYFYNSSGDFAHETIISLRAIGAYKTAEILQNAIDQFPGAAVPRDRAMRQEILEQIESKADEVWERLDKAFYRYEDKLNELNMKYIRKNRNSF